MQNPFEEVMERIDGVEERLASILKQTLEFHPGVDLDQFVPLKKVADILGITPKTLSIHKNDIQHVKRFGQIYFLKTSLIQYMEQGRVVKEVKKIMRTRRMAA